MKNTFKFTDLTDLTKTGIYKITCLANNKIYIGSACAEAPNRPARRGFIGRWNNHLQSLQKNKHHNKYLQSAFNKYGIEAFEFEILEFCNRKESNELELKYIEIYKTMISEKGFNILKGVLNNYHNFSQKHRNNLSKALKGKKRPLETVQKWSTAVQQIDQYGTIVAEYYSMAEAERQTGIMRQDIGQACIGKKIKKAGGYFWKKVKDIV